MLILYNIIQLLLLPILALALPFYLLARRDKREVIPERLGFSTEPLRKAHDGEPVIWIHALSVGEVTSALPLIKALRDDQPRCTLVFTASTRTGLALADKLAGSTVDRVQYFPFDLLAVVKQSIRKLKPDLFILVETDFWPNFLAELDSRSIPAILVNGRISSQSIRAYLRFGFFFRPVFDRFAYLCMQTAEDTTNMLKLGIDRTKLGTLGNLKFAPNTQAESRVSGKEVFTAERNCLNILCGSTHPGEESILLGVYRRLQQTGYPVHLLIAPRDIKRSDEIEEMARQQGFTAGRFSHPGGNDGDITLIDTIGDLAHLYAFADLAFIGGSLVPEGGHNPLEAARAGCPVLFGPHMDDFSEIRTALLEVGGGFEVADGDGLESTMKRLLESETPRREAGAAARAFVERHLDVIPNHIKKIKQVM